MDHVRHVSITLTPVVREYAYVRESEFNAFELARGYYSHNGQVAEIGPRVPAAEVRTYLELGNAIVSRRKACRKPSPAAVARWVEVYG